MLRKNVNTVINHGKSTPLWLERNRCMDTSVWKLLSFWIKQLPCLHPQIRFHGQEANPSAILTPIRFRRSTQHAIPIFTPHIAYLPQYTRTLLFIIQLWNQRFRGLSWVTCSKPPYIKRHSYITTHLITIFFSVVPTTFWIKRKCLNWWAPLNWFKRKSLDSLGIYFLQMIWL